MTACVKTPIERLGLWVAHLAINAARHMQLHELADQLMEQNKQQDPMTMVLFFPFGVNLGNELGADLMDSKISPSRR